MMKISQEFAASCLPPLEADANKYTRGLCELVVGSSRYPGAGVLACAAANRMGAGYVKAYTSKKAAQALLATLPSAVSLTPADFAKNRHEADERHPLAVVVGCGMEGSEQETALVGQVLQLAKAPVLVDGGGLSAFATPMGQELARARFRAGLPTVVTPHGGEAYRLLKALRPDVAEPYRAGAVDDAIAAQYIALALGATCVLKGPKTSIAAPDAQADVLLMDEGTAALAKAGTGDILAGIIGSLLAQGANPLQACAAGAFVHARAGRMAAEQLGARCVAAEDVISSLPLALKSLGA